MKTLILIIGFSLSVSINLYAQNWSLEIPDECETSIIDGNVEEFVCSAEGIVDEMRPEVGACSIEAEESIEGEGNSIVDPAVVTLVDFQAKPFPRSEFYQDGGKKFRKNINKAESDLSKLFSHIESALSDGAKEMFLELKNIALDKNHKDNENALANMYELQRGFHETMDKTKARPKAQQLEIASSYLENFFDDNFRPEYKRKCETENDGVVIDNLAGPKNMPSSINIPSQEIKSLNALGPEYKNKNINNLKYKEYFEATQTFNEFVEKRESEFEKQGYASLLSKNYHDFKGKEGSLCAEPQTSGPQNYGNNFKNNHYKTKDQNYLSAQLDQIKSTLDKEGKVTDLVISSSCSQVPNTQTYYKKEPGKEEIGIEKDLEAVVGIFEYIEGKDEWGNWLTRFKDEIKNKKNPFTISFEDLARLRSLKVAVDLFKGEPRLKNSGNKIAITWQGSNGNGTSGPSWDAKEDPGIYESHKFVNLSFKTSESQVFIEQNKNGNAYFSHDAFYMKCEDTIPKVIPELPPHDKPEIPPYDKPDKDKSYSSKTKNVPREKKIKRHLRCGSRWSEWVSNWKFKHQQKKLKRKQDSAYRRNKRR